MEPTSHEASVRPGARAGGTILVVEDEPTVRMLVTRILRKNGYQVLEAENGRVALTVAEGPSGTDIDLVVTDLVMPEMGGRELADALYRSRPEIPFLFISGYTEDERVHSGVAAGRALFLGKPFTPDALMRSIEAALA